MALICGHDVCVWCIIDPAHLSSQNLIDKFRGTDVRVGIFGRSYSDSSWEFTREIEEEELEF